MGCSQALGLQDTALDPTLCSIHQLTLWRPTHLPAVRPAAVGGGGAQAAQPAPHACTDRVRGRAV